VGARGTPLKVAVTVRAALIVTVQPPVPLHAPLQPANVEPEAALAVSVTRVPVAYGLVHVAPHEIPAGELVTVPVPEPFFETDRTGDGAEGGGGGGGEGEPTAPVVEPVRPRETVSPPAVKFTLPAKLRLVVGRNRTVMVRLAPGASVNDAPDTILNGALVLADPEMLASPTLDTVKVRSTVALSAMLPKLVVAVGVTWRSAWATALAALVHPLSLPLLSTAVILTWYRVPPLSCPTLVVTVCPDLGARVDDETE
jgi:hypothetical protein